MVRDDMTWNVMPSFDVCCLVLGRWVQWVSDPTAACVSGYDRWPWEREPLGLAAWEASISLVRPMRCGERIFLTVCMWIWNPFFFLMTWDPTSVSVICLGRYALGMYGTGWYDMKWIWVVGVCWLVVGRWVRGVCDPTAWCVLGEYRRPWENEPLGFAAWEARILLVITHRCGVRLFLAEYDFGFRINFRVFW